MASSRDPAIFGLNRVLPTILSSRSSPISLPPPRDPFFLSKPFWVVPNLLGDFLTGQLKSMCLCTRVSWVCSPFGLGKRPTFHRGSLPNQGTSKQRVGRMQDFSIWTEKSAQKVRATTNAKKLFRSSTGIQNALSRPDIDRRREIMASIQRFCQRCLDRSREVFSPFLGRS